MHSGLLGRIYMYAKCTLACWAEYTCMQNAPWLAGQNIHMCKKDPELLGGINMYKVHPGLLGRIYMYAKCTLACWAEYTCMQNAPWLAGQNIHMCKKDPELLGGINMYKVHPGLLGRIYMYAKCTLACWAEYT